MVNVEGYYNSTKEEQDEHLNIYLKIYCNTVVDATTNFEKAYNWFYEDDDVDIQVWRGGVGLLIYTEELLDIYKSLGFGYALDYKEGK